MPVYNAPAVRLSADKAPLNPDHTVWHYTTLDSVTAILETGTLRLRRVDKFEDPYEGSVPVQQIENQVPAFAGRQFMEMQARRQRNYRQERGFEAPPLPERFGLDPWSIMTKQRRAKTRCAHANCWRYGDESEAMWKLYKKRGLNLALRSSFERLVASLPLEEVFVGPISYRFYHEGPQFTTQLESLMHKRKGFMHEQELRVLRFDDAKYREHAQFLHRGSEGAPPEELPEDDFITWSLVDAVEAVILNPLADEHDEEEARTTIRKLAPALPVEQSFLSERRFRAQF